MSNRSESKFRLVFSTGLQVYVNWRDVYEAIFEAKTLAFALSVVPVLDYLASIQFIAHLPLPVQIAVVLVRSLFLLVLTATIIVAMGQFFARYSNMPIPVAFSFVASILIEEVIARYAIYMLSGFSPNIGDFWKSVAIKVVIATGVEVMFVLAIVPNLAWWKKYTKQVEDIDGTIDQAPAMNLPHQVTPSEAGKPKIRALQFIALGSETVEASDLVFIRAEEHYIFVQLRNRNFLARSRFYEATRAIPMDLGLQCHRSYWVSLRYIKDVRKVANGRMEILLATGDTLPVSRKQARAVSDLVKAQRLLEERKQSNASSFDDRPTISGAESS